MQEPDSGWQRQQRNLLQSWGLRVMVVDVFWNVVEGVFKYPVRFGSPICRSSCLEVVLKDECRCVQ